MGGFTPYCRGVKKPPPSGEGAAFVSGRGLLYLDDLGLQGAYSLLDFALHKIHQIKQKFSVCNGKEYVVLTLYIFCEILLF